MSIRLSLTPQEFFKERIEIVQNKRSINASEDTQYYLVNLLCEFIDPTKIEAVIGSTSNFMQKPLAIILSEAMEAEPSERAQILRRLGDVSLFVSGFFQEYFRRKTYDVTYYISMGSNAYASVADSKPRQKQLFSDLSKNFVPLVNLVSEVSEDLIPKQSDLLGAYELWNQTGSDKALRQLAESGVFPLKSPKITQ